MERDRPDFCSLGGLLEAADELGTIQGVAGLLVAEHKVAIGGVERPFMEGL